MAVSRAEVVQHLLNVFGNDDLTGSVIGTLYDQHKGDVESIVDDLLVMSKDAKVDEKKPPAAGQIGGAKPLSHEERMKMVDTIRGMFGSSDKLSNSVIYTVVGQNDGDVSQAVDMLLNIANDDEAIEAIRTMGADDKKKMQLEMKKDQEKRNADRQAQLQREIDEEKKRIADEQQRIADEKKKLERERAVQLAREKKLREEQERLKQQREDELKKIEELQRQETAKKAELVQLAERKRREEEERRRKDEEERQAALQREHEREVLERQKREEELKRQEEIAVKRIAEMQKAVDEKQLQQTMLIQQAAMVTLGVKFTTKTVVVSWALGPDMKATPNDWIGFYKLGQPSDKYREYIKTGGAPSGMHDFTAPKTPGLYLFKYFTNSTYNEIAVSGTLHLGPQLLVSASLRPSDMADNPGHFEVTYSVQSGELTTSDWFGLYRAEEKDNKKYLAMRYVAASDLTVKDPVTFRFEALKTPGDYVIRFFPWRCRYSSVLETKPIRVLNFDKVGVELLKDSDNRRPITVKVAFTIKSQDTSSKDYVAIYKTEAANNSYLSYAYVDPAKGVVELPAPSEVGKYEARYHSANASKYADVSRSDPFEIGNFDVVTAEVAGGMVAVSFNIFSQPKSSWDWVGIFKVGAPNNTFVAYSYVKADTNAVTFEVPKEHGAFEARYFSNALGKYVDFRKSRPFQIA